MTEMRIVQWAMGASIQEQQTNEEILGEAKVISIVMRKGGLEWFSIWHVKREGEWERRGGGRESVCVRNRKIEQEKETGQGRGIVRGTSRERQR